MKCYNCGTENAERASFCVKCGGHLAANMEKAKKTKNKRFKILLIILIVAICVSLLTVGGVWFVNANSPYNKQVAVGYNFLEEGKYEEAILAFDKAIGIEPRKKPAYEGKIEVYVITEEYDKIQGVIEAAAEYGVDVTLDKYDEKVRKAVEGALGRFVSGDLMEVNSKIIYADSTGIYVRNYGEETETNVYEEGAYEIISNGKTAYFLEYNFIKKVDLESGVVTEMPLESDEETHLLGKCNEYIYYEMHYYGNGMAHGTDTYVYNEKTGENYVLEDVHLIGDFGIYKNKLYYNSGTLHGIPSARNIYKSNPDGSGREIFLTNVISFAIHDNLFCYIEEKEYSIGVLKVLNLDTGEEKVIVENYAYTSEGWDLSNKNTFFYQYGDMINKGGQGYMLVENEDTFTLKTKDGEKELVKLQNVGFVKGYYDGKIYYGNFNEPGYKIYSQKAEEYVATPKPVPEPKKPSKSVEEIEALVVDYFNSNYSEGYDGNFAVFSHETRESDNGYYMTVRFQANYQTMDANRWFADVEVNDETGEMFWADEYECTLW